MTASNPTNNNRMVLLLIAGIPVTVILIATWLWYYVVHGDLDLVGILGTSNSGELVQPPRQLMGAKLSEPDGGAYAYSELDAKWTFLIPGGAVCSAACEKTLYTTRQIHIALGGDFNRVRRLYVSDANPRDTQLQLDQPGNNRPAPATFVQLMESEHREVPLLSMAAGDYRELLGEYLGEPSTWYLVDPGGGTSALRCHGARSIYDVAYDAIERGSRQSD